MAKYRYFEKDNGTLFRQRSGPHLPEIWNGGEWKTYYDLERFHEAIEITEEQAREIHDEYSRTK